MALQLSFCRRDAGGRAVARGGRGGRGGQRVAQRRVPGGEGHLRAGGRRGDAARHAHAQRVRQGVHRAGTPPLCETSG